MDYDIDGIHSDDDLALLQQWADEFTGSEDAEHVAIFPNRQTGMGYLAVVTLASGDSEVWELSVSDSVQASKSELDEQAVLAAAYPDQQDSQDD